MRPLIGTSWKMNLTSSEAQAYFRTLVPLVADLQDRDLFVLPPFTSIWVARQELASSRVAWGGQDVHHEALGAHTGDVSATMLLDLGCTYAEVGHSERRREHAERDSRTAAKVTSAVTAGLKIILCIGEGRLMKLSRAAAVVHRHLTGVLGALEPADLAQVVVAYEPHWAIGVGATAADPEYVSSVHLLIHDWLSAHGAPQGRVVYGGSVNEENAEALLAQPGIDGLFVGRAALDPLVFSRIAHAPVPTPTQPAPATRAGNRAVLPGGVR